MSQHVKIFTTLFVLAGAMLIALPTGVSASPIDPFENFVLRPDETSKLFANDAVLLSFRAGLTTSQKVAALNRYGLISDPECQSPYFVRALISPLERAKGVGAIAKINQMARDASFRYVEPDFVLIPDQVATDPSFSSQYALNNTGQTGGTADADIDAVEGWPLVSGALPPVVVAVLDNGTDINHQDLAANIWTNPGEIAGDSIDNDGNGFVDDIKGWDFSNNDASVLPASGDTHGTHTSGIVGMVRDNGFGGAGVAKNVRVMALQIAGGSTSFYSALANAIDYASLNGAKVISVSYTIDSYSQAFSDAVGRAATRDVVYVNSAGNAALNVDSLRCVLRNTWNNVIFVASSTSSDKLSSFTNYGRFVDIAAPGSSIYATYPNNTYATISGTSMAAPCAAAIIGQIRQVYPSLTAAQSIARARYSADRIPAFGGTINGGRANLAAALENDVVSPNAPGALTVLRRSNSAIEIRFNASGDDGSTGRAVSYDIRTSLSPINAGNFDNAESIYNTLGGTTSGTPITTQVTGLVPGRTYYLAVRAIDNVGNVSTPSTVGPVRMIAPTWIDDVEGSALWTGAGGWATTTTKSWSGAKSWTDSPAGSYSASANTSLTMNSNVLLPSEPVFRFRGVLALEWAYDLLLVELSTDNGATWRQVGSFCGLAADWRTYTCSLGAWAGQSVRLRLRITTDSSVQYDGVYIDDLSIVQGSQVSLDNVEGADTVTKFPSGSLWAKTTTTSFSPSTSWADSPAGVSAASSEIWLRSNANIVAPNVGDPEFGFMMRSAYRLSDTMNAVFSVDNGSSWVQTTSWPTSNNNWSAYTAALPNSQDFRFGIRYATASGTTLDGLFIDDLRLFGEPFWNSMSGNVTRSGFVGTPSVRPVTLEVRSTSNVLLGSYLLPATSVPLSSYVLDVLHTGTVNLLFKSPGFITRKLNGVALNWNSVLPSVILPNGDVDGSGEVDAVDIDEVISRFGAVIGNANYSVTADVDGSGEIDAVDIDLVIANFGAVND